VVVAKDFGWILLNLLASGRVENPLLRRLVPGKSLVALANLWGGCNGGGSFFEDFKALNAENGGRNRTKNDENGRKNRNRKNANLETANDDADGSRSETFETANSDRDAARAEIGREGAAKRPRENSSDGIEPLPPSETPVSESLEGSVDSLSLSEGPKISGAPSKMLEEIETEQRERKAVKSDDADVPEKLVGISLG
jgi:hypothetical protein